MKIIQSGNIMRPEQTIKRFRCRNCGCIFECVPREYMIEDAQRTVRYLANCPECSGLSFQVVMRGET